MTFATCDDDDDNDVDDVPRYSCVQKAFLSGLLPTAGAVNINAPPNLTEWSVAFLRLRLHHVLWVPSAAGLLHCCTCTHDTSNPFSPPLPPLPPHHRHHTITITITITITRLFNQGASPPSPHCTLPDKTIVDGTIGGNITKYNNAKRDQVSLVNEVRYESGSATLQYDSRLCPWLVRVDCPVQ